MTTRSSGIDFINVSKSYHRGSHEVKVLNDLTIDISEGEFVSIMGPSGSGKTTFLNILGSLDRADSGEVWINGKNIQGIPNSALSKWRHENIGFIFQFYNLLPSLNAAENIELPLLLSNLSSRERVARSKNALSLVGLADRASHRPSELSGGQAQRVAIARALVSDPKILLCDEPTGDLDRTNSDSILELLSLLHTEHHKTIVMVTHDERAAAFAQRHIQLDKRN